jgi:hypothetical protein
MQMGQKRWVRDACLEEGGEMSFLEGCRMERYIDPCLAVDGISEVLFGHAHQAGAHEEDDGSSVVELKISGNI